MWPLTSLEESLFAKNLCWLPKETLSVTLFIVEVVWVGNIPFVETTAIVLLTLEGF